MKTPSVVLSVVTAICSLTASTASAQLQIEPKSAFICSAVKVMDCISSGSCSVGTADVVNLPTFYEISLAQNLITGQRPDGTQAKWTILQHNMVNDSLLLQGNDGVHAWSASANLKTGKMVATVSKQDEAFVLFGACIQPSLK